MFKTAIVLAAVAATSVNAYAAYPDLCPQSELNKLAALAVTNSADILSCQTASGWVFIPPSAEPTVAQEIKMCNNANCQSLLAAITKLSPADCFLSLSNSASGINAKKLVDEFGPFCAVFGNVTTA